MKPITGMKRKNQIVALALCCLGALSAGVSPGLLNRVGVDHLLQFFLILTPIQIIALIYGLWGQHLFSRRTSQSKY